MSATVIGWGPGPGLGQPQVASSCGADEPAWHAEHPAAQGRSRGPFQVLPDALNDDGGVMFGDDVRVPDDEFGDDEPTVLAGWSSGVAAGRAGLRHGVHDNQSLRSGARSWPRASIAMTYQTGAIGPSKRITAAATASADSASASAEPPVGSIGGTLGVFDRATAAANRCPTGDHSSDGPPPGPR